MDQEVVQVSYGAAVTWGCLCIRCNLIWSSAESCIGSAVFFVFFMFWVIWSWILAPLPECLQPIVMVCFYVEHQFMIFWESSTIVYNCVVLLNNIILYFTCKLFLWNYLGSVINLVYFNFFYSNPVFYILVAKICFFFFNLKDKLMSVIKLRNESKENIIK